MITATSLPLNDEQRRDWLRLWRVDGVGPATFRELITRYKSAEEAIAALPQLSTRRRKPLAIPSKQDAQDEIEQAAEIGFQFLAPMEKGYPPMLREVHDAPPLLLVKGKLDVLERPACAIVGSRSPSVAGRKFARLLARTASEAEYVVVSGMARGIDGIAHEEALKGGTIACLAGGADRVYPPEHAELYDAILERGAIVGEMPLGSEPLARCFPRRNRLISGIAQAVAVVEATPRSGSMLTAEFAAEQGRDVFAVPGSPLDPRSEGANKLIREGATLISKPEDLLEGLNPAIARATPPNAAEEPDGTRDRRRDTLRIRLKDEIEHQTPEFQFENHDPPTDDEQLDEIEPVTASENALDTVLSLLSPSPASIDDVVRESGLPAGEAVGALIELEIEGRIERHPDSRVSLIPETKPLASSL